MKITLVTIALFSIGFLQAAVIYMLLSFCMLIPIVTIISSDERDVNLGS